MQKHTILFLAANPSGTGRLALDQQARAIHLELLRSGHRECFELETRWAAEPLDLLRELRSLKPTVVHFSGHGGRSEASERQPGQTPRRDVVAGTADLPGDTQHSLLFQRADGRAQPVSTEALDKTIEAAGSSVKLVVLSACYSDAHAAALLAHVDCVVGMASSVDDNAARSFAIGFYGGLGERASVAAAYKQGCAAISLEGLHDSDRPRLRVRDGVDADTLVLAGAPAVTEDAAVSVRRPEVKLGIPTTREDDFRAVLSEAALEPSVEATEGQRKSGPRWKLRAMLVTAALPALLATMFILGARACRGTCRVPGLRSLCTVVGLGDVPSPAEQALWDEVVRQDGEAGLRSYLQQYPTGVYAQEALSRLGGCTEEETPGEPMDVPFDLVVTHGSALPTEGEARNDALERANRQASTVCEPLKADQILSARAELHRTECMPGSGGFTCWAEGKIMCRVQKRIRSRHCRQHGEAAPR